MYSLPLLCRRLLVVHILLLFFFHNTHSLSIKPTHTTTPLPPPPHLPSIFPPDTPPGLRGEAVRTSLRTRGLYYTTSSFQSSCLELKGSGTISFLNSKFTTSFSPPSTTKQQPYATNSCYLTPRGRIEDLITVVVLNDDRALIVTSPLSNDDLYETLNRLIFPMDGITLERRSTDDIVGYTFVSTDEKRVNRLLSQRRCRLPSFDEGSNVARYDEGWVVRDVATQLPSCVARGYTFFLPSSSSSSSLFSTLLSPTSSEAALEIGLAEWNTLRIRSGYPCRHFEMTGDDVHKSNPLELCLPVDDGKGCYLGQEGIAAILKNVRGVARKLYLVVFDDEDNDFDREDDDGGEEEEVRLPRPGDELSVLGSHDEITVGTLTSVAEHGSTGECNVVGLALIKRSDSILKKMTEAGLDPPKEAEVEDEFWGIVKDPLEGLEVIVKGGSYITGRLRVIPRWRFRRGGSMWDEEEGTVVGGGEEEGPSTVMGYVPSSRRQRPVVVESDEEEVDDGSADPERLLREAEDAAREAEAAAAEAKRKAEKMELLKKRAEEAMAKRKKKAQ